MGDEQAPKGPLGFNRGISWIELAMSWMLYHNLYVPVVREDERKVKRLLQPASYSDAKGNGLTLFESGTMIQKIIDNLEALLQQKMLFPCVTTSGV